MSQAQNFYYYCIIIILYVIVEMFESGEESRFLIDYDFEESFVDLPT